MLESDGGMKHVSVTPVCVLDSLPSYSSENEKNLATNQKKKERKTGGNHWRKLELFKYA